MIIRVGDFVRVCWPTEPTLNIIASRDEHGELHLRYLHDPSCPLWHSDTGRCWCAQTVLVPEKGTFVDIERFLDRLREFGPVEENPQW